MYQLPVISTECFHGFIRTNPIELAFNVAKKKLQRDHGREILDLNVRICDMFRESISTCINENTACNIFEKCFVSVTAGERAWANRVG